jgi:hypothetical protein
MKISEMVEVLRAAERGEDIEYRTYLAGAPWMPWDKGRSWCFDRCVYRIAPKKKITLVDQLRITNIAICKDAADRIEELEEKTQAIPVKIPLEICAADELLAEIKRRMMEWKGES